MARAYRCPKCGRTVPLDEFLSLGGVCPACGKVLVTARPDQRVQSRKADEWVALRIAPVKDHPVEAAAVTQMLNALSQVHPYCLEIAGWAARRFLIVRCRKVDAAAIRGQITGLYGAPEIDELSEADDPCRGFEEAGRAAAASWLTLTRPSGLPLRTYDELRDNDPLLPIFGGLFGLQEGEIAVSQVLVQSPAPRNWAAGYKQEMLAVKRRQSGGLLPGQLIRWSLIFSGGGLVSLYLILGQWLAMAWSLFAGVALIALSIRFFAGSGIRWSESMEEAVLHKVSQNGYQVEIRLAAAAASEPRAREILRRLESAYRLFGTEGGNRFSPVSSGAVFNPKEIRAFPRGRMILGDLEIAALWHLPARELPDLLYASRVEDTLPDQALVTVPPENAWRLGVMGKSTGERLPVYLPRSAITRTHTLFLGKTRTGKTTGLENAIREIASERGRAIVAIDPHDDMVRNLLGVIPEERIDDVIYLNFADPELLPGLNLLDVNFFGGDPERTAEALGEVMKALFKKYWGPRMDVVFDRTILALAIANATRASEQQFTILDAIVLLNLNRELRRALLENILPENHIQRLTLLTYFQYEFEELTKSMREQVIMPVLSKLRPFESNLHLLAVFGQPASTFNPVRAVREGKILLVRTGATLLSQEYSSFIGSLFLNLVRRAVLSQGDLSPEERTPVTMIVDESQSFSGVDYGAALAQLAKFGGNLLLTTQGAHFIGRSITSDEPDDAQAFSKILANVDTLVVYRVSGEDAVALSETEYVGELRAEDLINLADYTAFVRFKKDGRIVAPFRVAMDPPPLKNEFATAAILAGRSRYSNRLETALEAAQRTIERISRYYGSKESASTAPEDGEIHLAAPDSPPENEIPNIQDLIASGRVGLGNKPPIDEFRDALGTVHMEMFDEDDASEEG